MLASLSIKDFAIIDELSLELSAGLNVMTGETGAGKTIIAQALSLILGERADLGGIRAGSERAEVTAVFDAARLAEPLRHLLDGAGIAVEDELIVHRVIAEGGRGRISVNGVPVTASTLKSFSGYLIDVSGQHEQRLLLDPAEHAAIVDAFGGNGELAEGYRCAHAAWAALDREVAELRRDERQAKERLDFLQHGLREIEAAALKADEEAEIESERGRLRHATQLEEKSRAAEGLLYGEAGAVVEHLDQARKLMGQCAELDPQAAIWCEALERARAELEGAAREIHRYAEGLESNPARIEELEDRLHLIRSLARKHGGSVESCLARCAELKQEVEGVERYDEIVAEKERALEVAALERRQRAAAFAVARRRAAEEIGRATGRELASFGMKRVIFEGNSEELPEERWDDAGPSRVEFLFSPNAGEPVRPLARIASGGELSRVMLALKGVLAGRVPLAATSLFDEVDAGIGGAAAEAVGRKLLAVAKGRQVLCITHLAQVAVHGQRHLRITKRRAGERTVAAVELLSPEERVEEIARMVGGEEITDAARAHAERMLADAGSTY